MSGITFARERVINSMRSTATASRSTSISHIQLWQLGVTLGVLAYLALATVTGTFRVYHGFMLLIVPLAVFAREGTRDFLFSWSPIIAFWLGYDRLRLVQKFLLSRVAVESPYQLEKALFGWLGGGEVAAHAWRQWLSSHATNPVVSGIFNTAQLVYLSHLIILPMILFILWIRARSDSNWREIFSAHVKAFTILHVLGIAAYLIIPVAPPWWISLHGYSAPTAELVAGTNLKEALDGTISQALIRNASQWFAAVPSLHGAYPVLLFLLARRWASKMVAALIAFYGVAMWLTTVALNQHYFIDLIAGAIAASLAYVGLTILQSRASASESVKSS